MVKLGVYHTQSGYKGMSKLKNNAIASVQGITYQNLVALEKCLELTEDQTLYIEI